MLEVYRKDLSDVVSGILGAGATLRKECTELKIEPSNLSDFVTQATYANANLSFDTFIDATSQRLNDSLSLQLLLYWAWYAYIVYFEPAILGTMLNSPQTLTYYNYAISVPGQPYFILTVDTFSKSIVISIRGTYSIPDAITDISSAMVPYSLKVESLAHIGFVTAARNVIYNLEKDGILLKYINEYGFPIKVVGHSYGAATASLVCAMLEEDRVMGKLPTNFPIRSFNYECPPVYNTYGLKDICMMANQITIVLGWDIVPRCSLSNVIDFLCKNELPLSKRSYLPGTLLWITYTEAGSYDKIYNVDQSSPSFTSINFHPNMSTDHSMSRVYGMILAACSKFNKTITIEYPMYVN